LISWRFPAALAVLVSCTPCFFAADATPGPGPRPVTVGFKLESITQIEDAAQTFTAVCYMQHRWHDPTVATGKRQIFLEDAAMDHANAIWRPYINFVNETTATTRKHAMLVISGDGDVEFDREFEVTLRCDFDLRSFPFDRQVLQFKIQSFAYSAKEARFDLDPTRLKSDEIKLALWQAGNLRWQTSVVRDEMERDEYDRLTISLDVARKPGFYVWQVFVPLFILFLIASTVFFLPAQDLSDRITVITTSLLTAVALSYAVRLDLPKVPYLTTIDRLFVVTYAFLGAKILGMLVIRQLVEEKATLAKKIDRVARWIFPTVYLTTTAAIVLLSITRH
jgi:hypothetical protein